MTATPQEGLWRILAVDDDPLIATLVADGLRSHGHVVTVASSPQDARSMLDDVDPHILMCDLNFVSGESGAEFVSSVREARPWVACVVLSSHRSPELAVPDAHLLPADVVYMVKSTVRSVAHIVEAVEAAMTGRALPSVVHAADKGTVTVTAVQAEVLRILASGASTRALAEKRGTSIRAVESLLVRLYGTLGLDTSRESNPRVEAIRMWQTGRVRVRHSARREATLVS
ncbi:response regulator [Microcella sp.]|uniref:response regulator n=1 Tax=Microcella sp. TaxID=1913979 RepID=UPI00255D64DC|nr:response regulator [Microcella sp.]MBX9472892.1 response regulator [Microcella sp.]